MADSIDPKFFRQVMSQVPTCVTVVTAMVDDAPQAMVIGSFVSISIDPPLAGFFCTTASETWQKLRRADALGVNVLSATQIDVSNACMRAPDERLGDLDWEIADGAPRISGTSAWLTLTIDQVSVAGDHEFALCNVETMEAADPTVEALAFYGGAYRTFAPADSQ